MFTVTKSPTYFAPCQLNTLSADGVLQEHKFDLQFKRHTKSQLEALDKKIKGWKKADIPARDRAVLEDVTVGWRGVKDEADADMAFSMTAVDRIEEDFPGFIKAGVESFYLSTQPSESAHLAAKN